MVVKTFLSDLKQFLIESLSSPVYQEGVLYLIIEELPNPRDSGLFKIQCGNTQIALDVVTLDEPGVVIANQLIGLHAATIRKYPYQKIEYLNCRGSNLGTLFRNPRVPD